MNYIKTKIDLMVIPTEIFSRISGYYRPVQQWNQGKQSEFKERKNLNYKGKE